MWANEQLLDSGVDIEALILAGLSSTTPDDCGINNAGVHRVRYTQHIYKRCTRYIVIYTPLHPCFCGNRWVLFSIY